MVELLTNLRNRYQEQQQQLQIISQPSLNPEVEHPATPPELTVTFESLVHARVNEARKKNGLSELQYDNALAAIAEKHSERMLRHYHYSWREMEEARDRGENLHYDPENRTYHKERYALAGYTGYTWSGENAAWFYDSTAGSWSVTRVADKIFEQWWNSPGHRQNMLSSNYNRQGLGVVVVDNGRLCMATQDFAYKR